MKANKHFLFQDYFFSNQLLPPRLHFCPGTSSSEQCCRAVQVKVSLLQQVGSHLGYPPHLNLAWSFIHPSHTHTHTHPTSSLGHKAIIVPLHCPPPQTSPIKHGDGHHCDFEKVCAGTQSLEHDRVFQCCVCCRCEIKGSGKKFGGWQRLSSLSVMANFCHFRNNCSIKPVKILFLLVLWSFLLRCVLRY